MLNATVYQCSTAAMNAQVALSKSDSVGLWVSNKAAGQQSGYASYQAEATGGSGTVRGYR